VDLLIRPELSLKTRDEFVVPLVMHTALHKKSKQSAKGAKYESRGQVPGKTRHVAPGCDMRDQIRPERPKYRGYYALSALDQIVFSHQGRRAPLRVARAPRFDI
jgi:hypothetical protein